MYEDEEGFVTGTADSMQNYDLSDYSEYPDSNTELIVTDGGF